jgi:hypothetical protein
VINLTIHLLAPFRRVAKPMASNAVIEVLSCHHFRSKRSRPP